MKTNFAEKSIWQWEMKQKGLKMTPEKKKRREEEDYKKEPHILFPAPGIRFSQKGNLKVIC